jgi:hypothetical protein
VGIYDWLLLGSAASSFVDRMAWMGVGSLSIAAAAVAATYPLAWRRKRKMAVEGTVGRGHRAGPVARILMRLGAYRPEERAVFAFIGQTIRRNQRYQTFLTLYGGVGLAIAAAMVLSVRTQLDRAAGLEVSDTGLHALLPLLLFWLIAGLRTAFLFPVDLGAGWLFASSGVELGRCAEAARRWAAVQGMMLTVCVTVALAAAGWDWRRLLVQLVLGVSTACVLADGLFAFRRGIPFTRPRTPGKTNVAVSVALYVGALPHFVVWMADLARRLESRLMWLWAPVAVAAALRLGLRVLQRREGLVYEVREEELEGTLTLGLN